MLRRLVGITAPALLALSCLAVVDANDAVAALPSECAVDEVPTVTCTYRGLPGSSFEFVTPAGVTSVHLRIVGRPGEVSWPDDGVSAWAENGAPAVVEAVVPTVGGEALSVELRDNGGQGGPGAGDGGGSTAVLRAGGALVAEAGGGGGAGWPAPYTCGSVGTSQKLCPYSAGGDAGAAGGDARTVGDDGHAATPARGGGAGPSGGAGGAGGVADVDTPTPSVFASGEDGDSSRGGDGGAGEFGGGGGGGGTVGGGGGGAGGTGTFTGSYGAGGGGGSSTAPAGGTVGVASEDAVAQITYALDGHAVAEPTAVDFGGVPVGTSASRSVTVSNTGPGPTIVYGDMFSGDTAEFTVPETDCGGTTVLAVGSSCTYTIRFRPQSAGVVTGTFSFRDTSGATREIDLHGTGTRPIAVVAPTAVDFGSVQVGTSAPPRTVTLSNTGDADLVVGAVTVGGDPAFTIASNGCTGTTVPPGASCTVTVGFQPSTWSAGSGRLQFVHNALGGSTDVPVTGAGITSSDLKTRGVGSLYTGRDHTVSRAVPESGRQQAYPVVILNEDTVPHTYQVHLEARGFPAAAELRTGFSNAALPSNSGNYLTTTVQPGRTVSYSLVVTPTGVGLGTSTVEVTLRTDFGAPIESVTTETNLAAPTHGTSSFELFARQGSQPFIGGPKDGETTTGPALGIGGSAAYVVRLRNDGSAASHIGLRLTGSDGCSGSFGARAAVGTRDVTDAAFAGTYVSRLLAPGAYQDVRVTIRRTALGCPAQRIRAESLDPSGAVVRTSYLLANAAYDASTD